MQKIIFGIFAHPDDEAFGPCGTLLTETRQGAELHLITLTAGDGDNSANPDNVNNLGSVRLKEWQASTRLLGATTAHHLAYDDGKLGNDQLVAIAETLEMIIAQAINGRDDIEVEIITFDLNGLTGHIDHIVATRSACLSFYRLQAQGLPLRRIRLYCLANDEYPSVDTGFVFMEPGRDLTEITEIVDARHILEDVKEIMRCHHSQRNDYETQIAKLGDKVAVDHFLVLT